MNNSIVIMEVGPGLIAIPVECKIMSIVSKSTHAHCKTYSSKSYVSIEFVGYPTNASSSNSFDI